MSFLNENKNSLTIEWSFSEFVVILVPFWVVRRGTAHSLFFSGAVLSSLLIQTPLKQTKLNELVRTTPKSVDCDLLENISIGIFFEFVCFSDFRSDVKFR